MESPSAASQESLHRYPLRSLTLIQSQSDTSLQTPPPSDSKPRKVYWVPAASLSSTADRGKVKRRKTLSINLDSLSEQSHFINTPSIPFKTCTEPTILCPIPVRSFSSYRSRGRGKGGFVNKVFEESEVGNMEKTIVEILEDELDRIENEAGEGNVSIERKRKEVLKKDDIVFQVAALTFGTQVLHNTESTPLAARYRVLTEAFELLALDDGRYHLTNIPLSDICSLSFSFPSSLDFVFSSSPAYYHKLSSNPHGQWTRDFNRTAPYGFLGMGARVGQNGMSLQLQDGSMKQVCESLKRWEGFARLWGSVPVLTTPSSMSTNFPSPLSQKSFGVVLPSSHAELQPLQNFKSCDESDGACEMGKSMGQIDGMLTPPTSPPFVPSQSYDIHPQNGWSSLQYQHCNKVADDTSVSLPSKVLSACTDPVQSTNIDMPQFQFSPATETYFDYKPSYSSESDFIHLQGTPSSLPALDSSPSSSFYDSNSDPSFSDQAHQDCLPRFETASNEYWNELKEEVTNDIWESDYDLGSGADNEQIYVRFGQGMDWEMESL